MTRTKDERRHPRVAKRLRVRSDHHNELELETIDLSAGGFSCSSPIFLAPMTKVALSLVLPPAPNGPTKREQVVSAEAVVVRTEPTQSASSDPGTYRVALFFSRMEDDDRSRLQEFLKSRN
jgi:hypothetical protein